MRAAILRRGEIVVDEVPEPEARPGHVVAKTLACGICGSDLHAREHGHRLVEAQSRVGGSMVFDPTEDLVMGHEFCAEIVETHGDSHDAAGRPVREGDVVCAMPIVIHNGRPSAVGYTTGLPGGYGEYMLLAERLLLPVPNGLDPKLAAMTEPMAVGRHAVEKAHPTTDDVFLVIGCGPVGLAVIAALKQKGLGPVVAADFSPRRRAFAEGLGADVVLDPTETSPYDAWADLAWADVAAHHTGDAPFDRTDPMLRMSGAVPRPTVAFECVGVPGVLEQMMGGALRDTRVVVVGVCMEADSIQPLMGISKELNLQFVLGYSPDEFSETLHHIAEGDLDVEPLITDVVGLDGVANAFDELADPERHAKVMVEPHQRGG